MLRIKRDGDGWDSWWLGCEIPESAEDRVVTFQADGDELYMILQIMEATRHTIHGVSYSKMSGLFVEKLDKPCGCDDAHECVMCVLPTKRKK